MVQDAYAAGRIDRVLGHGRACLHPNDGNQYLTLKHVDRFSFAILSLGGGDRTA